MVAVVVVMVMVAVVVVVVMVVVWSCGRGRSGGRGSCFGRGPLGAGTCRQSHRLAASSRLDALQVDALRSTLSTHFSHNSPFRILVLYLRRSLSTLLYPSPPRTHSRAPCSSTLMPVTINYDLQAIAGCTT
jgi:hypothetical protein